MAAADLAADPDYKKGMNLMVLVVDDKHREKGIASALLEAVCNKVCLAVLQSARLMETSGPVVRLRRLFAS